MSETPRTDAALPVPDSDRDSIWRVARQLERELAEAHAEGENLHARCRQLEAERDEARAALREAVESFVQIGSSRF